MADATTPPLLQLDNVGVAVEGREICHNVSLTINPGETHILLGPNGSGKSSLLNAIMGVGPFEITSGTAVVKGRNLQGLTTSERAALGLGMAMQHPPKLQGVTIGQLAEAIDATDRINTSAETMNLEQLVDRDVNVGFSGGEIKRWEVMKLLLQQPDMCLFDEPESGVDLEHVAVVGRAVKSLLSDSDRGALVITHTGFILDYLDEAKAHLMVDGTIIRTGHAREMFETIRHEGYAA